MTPGGYAREALYGFSAFSGGTLQAIEEAIRAALRERDARWAAAVKASGLMLSPDSDNEAWKPLRALLEEAGK